MLDFTYLVSAFFVAGVVSSAIVPTAAPAIASTPNPPLAQQSVIQQGNQILLNGRSYTASWQQGINGTRLEINDFALLTLFGLQLLSTDFPTGQPVQWFTPANQTFSLPARFTSTLRYLDISNLARQFGWQTTISGSTLQISTPVSRIVGIRQSQQPWGDRLVIELDQPTPWQTNQTQEIQLNLDAQIDPNLSRQFRARPGKFLSSVNIDPSANQTRFRIGLSSNVATRIWSLSAPNRIVVDIRPDAMIEQSILWAPGLRWRQQIVNVGNTRIPTVWLEINPRQPGINLQPILPNLGSMTGIASLVQTARQAQVVGAMNGGFFNRNRQLPLGAIRLNGQWLSGPILNRGAIAWDNAGNVIFGRLALRETITTQSGQRLPLTHLNSGYIQAGIARYTKAWGTTYNPLSDGEIIISVQNNQVIGQQAIEKAGTISVQIPGNGYILVLRSNQSAAGAFPPGTILQLESMTDSPDFLRYPQILGAGPLLLHNQQIVLDAKAESFSNAFAIESAPRSAIAQRPDGTLLLVAAHTRLDSTSLKLSDMAQLLQQLGAVHALNLDGGSSTTLYLGGAILDRPPSSVARVHNGIGIYLMGNP